MRSGNVGTPRMRGFVREILLVVNTIFFALTAVFGLVGVVYEILGPGIFDKMLLKLRIPWSFEQGWNVSFICLAVLIITFFVRKKLFKE